MVVGEAQIHGQVRDAWEASRPRSGAVLNRLFQTALLVGGRVRSETALGHGAMSVSSAAVQLAKKIFGSLVGKRAMVLGAGEMAELALASLQAEGVRAAIVANRTFERAQALAATLRRDGGALRRGWTALADVDVLLCSTAAPRAVVSAEHVRDGARSAAATGRCAFSTSRCRATWIPRSASWTTSSSTISTTCSAVVSANLERRRGEMPAAEAVIAEEVEKYWQWVAGLAAVPVLTQFREEMDRRARARAGIALRRLGDLTARAARRGRTFLADRS